ncbi:hypothetical protein P7K49_037625, partial [Saguinus oedipus]
ATIGSFQFGYNTVVINAPEMIIKEFVNNTSKNKKNAPPSAHDPLVLVCGHILRWWYDWLLFHRTLCQPLWRLQFDADRQP